MITYLWVAIGSALGGVLRYWLAGMVAAAYGESFPLGTLIINMLGSLIIGFFATVTGADGRFIVPSDTRIFVMVGICGGFTTFSAFSLQTLNLARQGEFFSAGLNIVLSVVLCLICVTGGHLAATYFNLMKGS